MYYRIRSMITALLLFTTTSLASPSDIYKLENPGYSKVCQEAIAMTAMSKVESKALAQLKRLLMNKDAVDVVDWGNKVAKRYPTTESYHYQNIKYDRSALHETGTPKCAELTLDNIDNCSKGPCLLDVLTHFYVKLVYPDRSDEFPLTYPKYMEFTDVDALKLVINLMTELHNPMAYSMDGETNPRLAHGHVDVGQNTQMKTTAYDLGRGQICDIYSVNYPSNWNSGWTHYQGLGAKFYKNTEQEFGSTLEANIAALKKWAVEIAGMRCQIGKAWQHGFSLTPRDVDAAFRSQFRRTLLEGGVRLSVVIHKILDSQKGATLRKGSNIDVPVDVSYGKESYKKAEAESRNIFKTIAINCTVIAVVLLVGWFALIRDTTDTEGSSAYGEKESSRGISMSQILGKDKKF